MKFKFLLVILLIYVSPVTLYADATKGYLRFNLESAELLDKWGRENTNLKLLVFSEAFTGEKTKTVIPADKTISASLREKIELSRYTGLSIPITNSRINVYIIAINETDSSFLTSLGVKAVSRLAQKKSLMFFKNFSKLSKITFWSWVGSEAVALGAEKGLEEAIEYLKKNEIGRVSISVDGYKGWKNQRTVRSIENTIKISYTTDHIPSNKTDNHLPSNKIGNNDHGEISSLGLKMVSIKGGTFQMGCISGKNCQDNEKPVHTVRVKSFYMGATEVTFDQWDACVAAGACSHKPDDNGWGRGNRPVINVSWNDAQEFIAWLRQLTGKAYRLPTEAEWEYAARGGSTTQYPWGDSIGANRANCIGCSSRWGGEKTAPVASFSAYNGLYDMQGNVWEWTCSAYTKKYNGSEGKCINNNDSQSYPVSRSGSWYSVPLDLRSAYRHWSSRDSHYLTSGFRIARTR